MQSITAHVTHNRPFAPPVHVVILPSQLPLDLRVGHLQVMDESRFVSTNYHFFSRGANTQSFQNGGFVPEHMNVLGADEALSQVRYVVS